MRPDWVSNTGPLFHELDALPTALRGSALKLFKSLHLEGSTMSLY